MAVRMIIMGTSTSMIDAASRLTLLSWLSPAFPTGGFAYSAGLEAAAHDGVETADDLRDWLAGQIENGPLWNDAVLLAAAWAQARDEAAIAALADLARALAGSLERLGEIEAQGTSFAMAARDWLQQQHQGGTNMLPECLAGRPPYVVALGAAARMADLPLADTLAAFLHAFAVNQLQAAIRLSLIGQSGAVGILAGLSAVISETARRAAQSSLEDLGSAGILADIAAMHHETLEGRMFRS
jgi:urease accessory protein